MIAKKWFDCNLYPVFYFILQLLQLIKLISEALFNTLVAIYIEQCCEQEVAVPKFAGRISKEVNWWLQSGKLVLVYGITSLLFNLVLGLINADGWLLWNIWLS